MAENTYNSFGNWELRKKLGTGGFGAVILWKNRINQMEVATKSLNQNEQLCTDEVQKLKERWAKELEFMRHLNVDCIVRALELDDKAFVAYLNERHAWRPLPVLIMEYCNGGDLRNHLQKNENLNGLCEFEIREILRALRNALDHMHNKFNIKHRDLKPDNIVIHRMDNGKKVYKLTDFGFARHINDKTMLQSVVGTRNYFAPEIVDTGGYTKTVDYWSVGVIAFEMLCGILPFIPHQTMYNKILQMKQKPTNCIAITEDFVKPNKFICHERIFAENRVSDIFRHEIEKWLRLALDVNHRTRGTTIAELTEIPNQAGGRVLRFYSDLDALLNMRILSIFCLSTYRYYYYQVHEQTTLEEFLPKIIRDSGIPLERIYFILPIGHPLKAVRNVKQALDFFVGEWCDASDYNNPPAMLYIADAENVQNFQEQQISAVIQHCFVGPTTNPAVDLAPNWLIQKFALDINFMVTNEQRLLKAFMYSLQQYAVSVEHEIFAFDQQLKQTIHRANISLGMIVQFFNSLNVMQRLEEQSTNFLTDWQQKIAFLQKEIEEIANNVAPKLQTRYNSALRRIKEQAQSKIYDEIVKEDIFMVARFQRHLQSTHQNYKTDELMAQASACKKCRGFVNDTLQARANFLENKTVVSAHTQIGAINKEFMKIRETTDQVDAFILQRHKKIEEYTLAFYTELFGNLRNFSADRMLCSQITAASLVVDSTPPESTTINGICDSFSQLMDISTKDLMKETQESLRLMAMDLDAPLDDMPTTINSN